MPSRRAARPGRSRRPSSPRSRSALHRPNDQLLSPPRVRRLEPPLPALPPTIVFFCSAASPQSISRFSRSTSSATSSPCSSTLRDRPLRAGDILGGGRPGLPPVRQLPAPRARLRGATGGRRPRPRRPPFGPPGRPRRRPPRAPGEARHLRGGRPLPEARLADGRLVVAPIRRATPEAAEMWSTAWTPAAARADHQAARRGRRLDGLRRPLHAASRPSCRPPTSNGCWAPSSPAHQPRPRRHGRVGSKKGLTPPPRVDRRVARP